MCSSPARRESQPGRPFAMWQVEGVCCDDGHPPMCNSGQESPSDSALWWRSFCLAWCLGRHFLGNAHLCTSLHQERALNEEQSGAMVGALGEAPSTKACEGLKGHARDESDPEKIFSQDWSLK